MQQEEEISMIDDTKKQIKMQQDITRRKIQQLRSCKLVPSKWNSVWDPYLF